VYLVAPKLLNLIVFYTTIFFKWLLCSYCGVHVHVIHAFIEYVGCQLDSALGGFFIHGGWDRELKG
jgi:hypothetical protein